jgi:hypothetical protein
MRLQLLLPHYYIRKHIGIIGNICTCSIHIRSARGDATATVNRSRFFFLGNTSIALKTHSDELN